MDPSSAATVITAICGGVAVLGGAYGAWIKNRQDRLKGVVAILEAHIDRQGKEIRSHYEQILLKQEAIDELYDMNLACEVAEAEMYGMLERARDHINRLAEDLTRMGSPHHEVFDLPIRRQRSSSRAAYLQKRAKYNMELARAVAEMAAGPKGGES